MLGLIFKFLGGGILKDVIGGVKTIFGDKEKRQDQAANADAKVLEQFAAESLQQRENRTWFDSLVDGLNRLPRPLGFFLTVWIFIWPIWNMASFQSAMVSYEGIPEWIAGLIITVWSLYFTGRFLSKDMKGFKARSSKEIKEMLEKQKAIHEALTNKDPDQPVLPEVPGEYSSSQPALSNRVRQGRMSDSQYEKELKSEKVLSLPSISEWNRRNNPNF